MPKTNDFSILTPSAREIWSPRRWIPGGIAVLLSSCWIGGANAPTVPQSVIEITTEMALANDRIVEASKGQIKISPETPVCYFPGTFVVDERRLFQALGQAKSTRSGSRLRPVDVTPECKAAPDTVFILGEKKNNSGNPYKLVLTVWQGDPSSGGAAWVGMVARPTGFRPDSQPQSVSLEDRPDFLGSFDVEEVRNQMARRQSIASDIDDLSDHFIIYLKKGDF